MAVALVIEWVALGEEEEEEVDEDDADADGARGADDRMMMGVVTSRSFASSLAVEALRSYWKARELKKRLSLLWRLVDLSTMRWGTTMVGGGLEIAGSCGGE